MDKIDVPEYKTWMKIADFLMIPLMFLLSGFDKYWLQQTHAWHTTVLTKEKLAKIDRKMCAAGLTDSKSKFKGTPHFYTNLGLPHIPIIGGWKKYMVIEVASSDYKKYWTTGWIIHKTTDIKSDVIYAQFQNKPINSNRVRVLMAFGNVAEFFAINDSQNQITVRIIDTGVKGDGKYNSTRLH